MPGHEAGARRIGPDQHATDTPKARSDHPDHHDLAECLMDQGIGSISLNPDTVVETWQRLAKR